MFDQTQSLKRPRRREFPRSFLGIGAALSLSTAALADTPPEGPRSLTPNDIETWIASRIDPAGWRYLYFDGDGAYFLSPDAPWRTTEGNWRFVIREELFRRDAGAQSMIMQTEVDCEGRKLRLPGVQAFHLHNLKGAPEDRGPIEQWVSPETAGENAHLAELCSLARAATVTAEPTPGQTPPPRSPSATDIQSWVERYLDLTGWRVIETVPDGVNLAALSGATRAPDGALRIWSRTEFFRPESYPEGGPTSRSARQLMELDCKAARAHIVQIVAYALNNLKGAGTPLLTLSDAPWQTPAPGTHQAEVVQTLCKLAESEAPLSVPRHRRHRRSAAARKSGHGQSGKRP